MVLVTEKAPGKAGFGDLKHALGVRFFSDSQTCGSRIVVRSPRPMVMVEPQGKGNILPIGSGGRA